MLRRCSRRNHEHQSHRGITAAVDYSAGHMRRQMPPVGGGHDPLSSRTTRPERAVWLRFFCKVCRVHMCLELNRRLCASDISPYILWIKSNLLRAVTCNIRCPNEASLGSI